VSHLYLMLRASATSSARHNTMFQGLAADGAKLALWKLWRAGYRLVNFIHDEILVELPERTNLALHAEVAGRTRAIGFDWLSASFRSTARQIIC
jgi:hypothetical protein